MGIHEVETVSIARLNGMAAAINWGAMTFRGIAKL